MNMAMGTYKLKRLISFILVGLLPPLISCTLVLTGFPLIGQFMWSVIVGAIMAGFGFVITGTNAWIKAIQGDALIVIDVNSTGVGKFYTAKVKNNPFGGVSLNVDFEGGQIESRAYDRKVTHRLQAPLKIVMQSWNKLIKKPIENNDVDELEKRISFSIPKEQYEKSAWHYDYLTVLYYNSETGMFLTKLEMREQEKQMQAEYLSLNEWRELKELNKVMRDFTRNVFDLIGQKFGGVFGNPMVKLIIIILVGLGILGAIIMFFPQIQATIFPAVGQAAQSTGNVIQPNNVTVPTWK